MTEPCLWNKYSSLERINQCNHSVKKTDILMKEWVAPSDLMHMQL